MLNAAAEQETIIGEARSFLEVIDQTSQAAKHGRPVLVIGERGTGKEMIAARLHFLSPRWERNFIQVNCAALSENLLDSELFGHEAGSFTGATSKRIGRFEEAHKGTLFLDEIATISMSAQEKILRITEYGMFQRMGGNKTLQVDVRLIGATNIDLPTAAERGEFRADLLDRLAMDVITLPPLRERREDIITLAFHFGQRVAHEREWDSFPGFTTQIIEDMLYYDWPGNIRELKNVIERAVYYAEDEFDKISSITLDPFDSPFRPKSPIKDKKEEPAPISPPPTPAPVISEIIKSTASEITLPTDYFKTISTMEKDLLIRAMELSKHNQRDAAKALNLPYHKFRHQLKKHDL